MGQQLTCNGVLEGIRICMRGFPNRMLYPDFKSRYAILGAAEIASSSDNKTAVYALLDKIEFSRDRYRLGHTKVFFRAGALAGLEEARDNIVLKLLRYLQAECHAYNRLKTFRIKRDQRELMKVIQRNFRKFATLRNWGWFIIIQKTRPLIGQINLEEELKILEEKANAGWGAYQDAVNVTKELEIENKRLKDEEIVTLTKQSESEQGNLSVYQDRQAKAAGLKAELEGKLTVAQNTLAKEEGNRQQMIADRKTMEGDLVVIKKDIEDLELALQKLEQEKTNRDHNIRSVSDEVAQQDEVINRLDKEKKMIGDNQAKAMEDLQAAQEKVNHLNDIKGKLDSTLGELEDGVNREKRARGDVDKTRRKVEGELRMAQETVNDLETHKRELEGVIARKEKDIAGLNAELEDKQGVVAKVQKAIKENQGRVEEHEEELEAVRQARAKAERQRSDLAAQMESLAERLGEAGGATSAQIELNKKREDEVEKETSRCYSGNERTNRSVVKDEIKD